MPAGRPRPPALVDLASMFVDYKEARRRIGDLVAHAQIWRGEVTLETGLAEPGAFVVRADPVYASPGRVRGFVLLLTDNREQKAASAARRRFQDGLAERHRSDAARSGSLTDLTYYTLMSTVVENAQLAALEITDRADVEKMPQMLESVRASVSRTAEVLEQLIHRLRGTRDRG